MGIGMGMGMGMGMGGFGMGGFGMNRSGMGGMGGNQQQRPKLRPTVSVDFEVDRPTNQQRLNQVQVNLSKLPQPGRFTGVNVQMVGSKAVVTGSLPNSKDADVLKQLLLLEPGIYEVDVRSLADSQSSGSDRRAAGSGQYDTESRSTVEVVPLPRPAR
ncbi:MAG: hypothetical protein KF752_20785 [Pirellulaceae bacterium]|nr:hypothetical protein [Pirellulaceae bacterium]